MTDDSTFLAWRKKKPLLLKIAFTLLLAGFVLGYTGGASDSMPLIAGAFALWGAAGITALLMKS